MGRGSRVSVVTVVGLLVAAAAATANPRVPWIGEISGRVAATRATVEA